MQIDVFGKESCARCETTKHKLEHFIAKFGASERVQLTFYDMDTEEGMTEGAFRDVFDVPTTIVCRDGQALARWAGQIPPSADIKGFLGTA
ncbi:MAG: hypothetical protein ACODAJ_04250 [Planctomycetota bacterium]